MSYRLNTNIYTKDIENKNILLSHNNEQVMMEWEKPYMIETINRLKPFGDVLEIGFGLGYSATHILTFPINSYTVIECDPVVIKKAKEWAKQYSNIEIIIIEGRWQSTLNNLGIYDTIYFDDFPLDIHNNSSLMEKAISNKRLNIFIDLCIQNHTRIGSKLSWYLNHNNDNMVLSSDTEPFISWEKHKMNIVIPKYCEYRDIKEQWCSIFIIKKVKEFDFIVAQQYALNKMLNFFKI